MRTFILFIALLCMQMNLIGQITLQPSDINVGESITQIVVNGVFVQDAGESGENCNWDYSWFTGIDEASLTYQETNATGLSEVFTSSNFALTNEDFGEFYNHSNQATEKVGMLIQSILIDYQNPQTALVYPFSYLQSYTDSFIGTYTYQEINFETSGSLTATADAYGNLSLPYGTVENVLRIRYDIVGSEYYEYNGMPNLNNFSQTTYVWYAEESSIHPILSISFIDSDESSQTNVNYLAQSLDLNEDLLKEVQYSLYPNPVDESGRIELTLEESKKVEISIYSLLGVKLKNVLNNKLGKGKHSIDFEVVDIPPGNYFMNTRIGKQEISRILHIK